MSRLPALGASAATLALAVALPALAATPTDSTNLRNAVTLKAIRAHQAALQAIADANGGTRASGTPGYDASLAYVRDQLKKAGYKNITVQNFDFPFFSELAPSSLARTAPTPATYVNGIDFLTMDYSGSTGPGGITAPVQAVDVVLPPGPVAGSSTSGCESSDFVGFTGGNIALVQRGTCDFSVKAQNALAAGAAGVIVFNEGTEGQPDRQELFGGTLGGPIGDIPVLSTSFAVGEALAGPGTEVTVVTQTVSEVRNTDNLIAETKAGRTDRVVVVGAHLDSVPEGPGINDNGSGTATILEIARQMAGLKLVNQVRFAFWGAEEAGLFGSQYYVDQLSKRAIKNIAVNLNFDMLGSPNFIRYVYDGDGSDTPDAGPNGSATVEDIFLDYFAKLGLPTAPTAFDGRSDYGPFIAVGIPAGGLFSGAEGIKTAEEQAIFGGTAGAPLDPCYHQACDTFANNNRKILNQFADAAAHATLQFAMTKSSVKGTSRASDRAVAAVTADRQTRRGDHFKK